MPEPDPERDTVIILPEAQAAIDKMMAQSPEAADDIRDILAVIRQAHQGWQSGKYPSFEDAMEALTGERPERVDLDDPEEPAA